MVTHKTESTLKYLEPSWPKIMTSEQSARVVEHNTWFYKIFYPEVLK
jgi:hypothetical protein